jgi:hypothetical protein
MMEKFKSKGESIVEPRKNHRKTVCAASQNCGIGIRELLD